MINCDMRNYDYFTIGAANEYGQQSASNEAQGSIKMAIFSTSTAIQDNINYKQANYIGLTFGAVNDSYIIKYGDQKLKVQYVISKGRLKQVFLVNYG